MESPRHRRGPEVRFVSPRFFHECETTSEAESSTVVTPSSAITWTAGKAHDDCFLAVRQGSGLHEKCSPPQNLQRENSLLLRSAQDGPHNWPEENEHQNSSSIRQATVDSALTSSQPQKGDRTTVKVTKPEGAFDSQRWHCLLPKGREIRRTDHENNNACFIEKLPPIFGYAPSRLTAFPELNVWGGGVGGYGHRAGVYDSSAFREVLDLPLYVPMLPNLRVPRGTYPSPYDFMQDPSLYTAILRRLPKSQRRMCDCGLSDKHFATLVQNAFVEPSLQRPFAYCRIFGHPEPSKGRSRLIVHPKELNEAVYASPFAESAKCKFPSPGDINAVMAQRNVAAVLCIDMVCWFYQFQLEPPVRRFFGVRYKDRDYVFTKLPMGFCLSPQIANRTVQCLAEEAWGRDPTVHWVTCIDNVFLFITRDQVKDADSYMTSFREAAVRRNATIKSLVLETVCPEILGVKYDLVKWTAQVTDRFAREVADLFTQLSCSPIQRAYTWWKGCACLVWASTAVGRPLGANLEVLRLMSRIGRAATRDSRGCLLLDFDWELTAQQHERILKAISVHNQPFSIQGLSREASYDATIYSDAATTPPGLGLVLVKGNKTWVGSHHLGEPTPRKENNSCYVQEGTSINVKENITSTNAQDTSIDAHVPTYAQNDNLMNAHDGISINALEMRALTWAAKEAARKGCRNPLFLVDSQVVLGQVKKGYSLSWSTNADIQRILAIYPRPNIQWIPSEQNLADPLSRQFH